MANPVGVTDEQVKAKDAETARAARERAGIAADGEPKVNADFDFQSRFYNKGLAICAYWPHLDVFHFRFGGEVLTCHSKYAGLAEMELVPELGFLCAPIESVRRAVDADPLITK
jgi:hypothetical protein